MGLFDSLATIVTAPVKVLDELVLKPVAEMAQDVVDGVSEDRDK